MLQKAILGGPKSLSEFQSHGPDRGIYSLKSILQCPCFWLYRHPTFLMCGFTTTPKESPSEFREREFNDT